MVHLLLHGKENLNYLLFLDFYERSFQGTRAIHEPHLFLIYRDSSPAGAISLFVSFIVSFMLGCGHFSSNMLQERTIIVRFPLNCVYSQTDNRLFCIDSSVTDITVLSFFFFRLGHSREKFFFSSYFIVAY